MDDLEIAKELKHHRYWEWVCKYMDEGIEVSRASLETCTNEVTLAKLQEKIRTLRSLKRLPQDVIDKEEIPR